MSEVKIELQPGITVSPRERERKYVYGGGRPYLSMTIREKERRSRMYVWPKNESVMENFVNRRHRPVEAWRSVLKSSVLPKLAIPTTGMRWDTKAGCSTCPCSPGFVLPGWFGIEGPVARNSWDTIDFHVTIDFAVLDESAPSTLDPDDVSIRAAIVGQQIASGITVDGALVESEGRMF
jgi:hypothetical protein